MNTKTNALLASLLLATALGTAVHAEDKVDLSKGSSVTQHEMKGMPEKAMHETGEAQQEQQPTIHKTAQKKAGHKKVAHKKAHKTVHKPAKHHHHKHHVVKHKAAAVKTSAKAANKPAK